jgi:hypothetical protein
MSPFSNLARCGCEILFGGHRCRAVGFLGSVRGAAFMFHAVILGGSLAVSHGVLPDRIPRGLIRAEETRHYSPKTLFLMFIFSPKSRRFF